MQAVPTERPTGQSTVLPTGHYILFWTLAVVGCAADLATKHWAFAQLGMPGGRVQWVWPGYVGCETSLNQGALFGLGQGMVFVFAGLSVVAAIGIVYWLFFRGAAQDRLLTLALGGITGGIAGNLYDRLGLHGLVDFNGQRVYAVRDWILFQASDQWRWPNFNIADSLLVCGAVLLVWHAFWTHDSQAAASEARAGS